jgi:two-component system sensor histidine kinase CpxA
LDSLLLGRAGDRIQSLSEVIRSELNRRPIREWNEILEQFGDAYQVQFFLFRNNGSQAAGTAITLPGEISLKVANQRDLPGAGTPRGGGGRQPLRRSPNRMPDAAPREPPLGREYNRQLLAGLAGPFPKFLVHTPNPSRYWVGVHLPILEPENRRPVPMTLLTVSSSISAGGLILDLTPWIVVGAGAFCFSVLFWIPLLRGITRSISQMTHATEQIAEGHFDARVAICRRDELGRLGSAINRMALRLAGFVTGQKRFLGDIAHELCAPLARIQMALGILEQQADAKQQAYVNDLREEVQQMSSLIHELLSFSKAGLQPKEIKLQSVPLNEVIQAVVAREVPDQSQIELRLADHLQVQAEPELLSRALANLIRNALQYAGQAGVITLSTAAKNNLVLITVADQGPGVPEDMLDQIFDPFFRLEASRSRDTGGAGLGLAIVKTCIEACQGTVTAKNRQPSGLQVEIVLN